MSYEPALSASMGRTHLNQDGPSMADQLPSVNFNFDDLREHMNRFTSRFDDFIEKGRKRVLEERNQFRMNVTELQEDQKQTSRAIEIETLKAQSHTATLQKETAEKSEMQSQIAHLQTHRDNLLTSRSTLSGELAQLQQTLQARKSQQSQHAKYLQGQSRHNVPELQFWEDHLCMGISGCGQEDRLKFNFTHVCEKDWEREAWFELDTSSREYRVLKTSPKLENSDVEAEVEKLNESRELGPFFKGMRTLFVKCMK
ncbi:hypothetical protein BLS_006866 [Venturia inaequalis]|uniref:Kinetochore protein SPC25 n=1 Tax=Venturia inaequalis TaxID=5025 RepID=A0A8H3UB20_VENIN|nr:hypothetical protein BLS_006866 [Venturia inaequalis]KAE9968385.1 hypothetical protein EG328_007620 [Venturia inaequalis]KAE9973833.1 hypothetical protein EG327_008947 [Venturia inaequalis]